MFDFLRGSGMRSPSAAIRGALKADGLPPDTNLSELGVVESRGTFAGRKVTYFRVFDPMRAAAQGVDVLARHAYQDLSGHLHLVLRAGFIEADGAVNIYARPPAVNADLWRPNGQADPKEGAPVIISDVAWVSDHRLRSAPQLHIDGRLAHTPSEQKTELLGRAL